MIEFQRLLLGDTIRNDAFVRALKKVIVPGKTTVSDIGSGTGYLSFMAEQMGAKECFLYEMSALLPISKDIGRKNGIKRCRYFGSHSTQMAKPTQTDVVVSETLGNFALEENIIETLNDARRFLKPPKGGPSGPGGTMIPCGLTQFIAPVIASRLYDELNVWDRLGKLDFTLTKEMCMNNMYVKEVSPKDLLGKGSVWDTVDFTKQNKSIREKTIEWKTENNMMLYGFAVWWDSTLVPGVTLTTSPFAPLTHWKQIYFPVIDPLPVKKDQRIRLRLHSDTRYEVKINVVWETEVLDGKKVVMKMSQDMRRGFIP